jgi:hypothetical protein
MLQFEKTAVKLLQNWQYEQEEKGKVISWTSGRDEAFGGLQLHLRPCRTRRGRSRNSRAIRIAAKMKVILYGGLNQDDIIVGKCVE